LKKKQEAQLLLRDHTHEWQITPEVTGNDITLQNAYDFLLMFNSNYSSVLHHFCDI